MHQGNIIQDSARLCQIALAEQPVDVATIKNVQDSKSSLAGQRRYIVVLGSSTDKGLANTRVLTG